MNTASLELCKELYEISGWKTDIDFGFYWTENEYEDGSTLWNLYNWSDTKNNPNGNYVPAYDLGYTLRKLPNMINDDGWFSLHQSSPSGGHWCAHYSTTDFRETYANPEDATCKLAIELFKQGFLK